MHLIGLMAPVARFFVEPYYLDERMCKSTDYTRSPAKRGARGGWGARRDAALTTTGEEQDQGGGGRCRSHFNTKLRTNISRHKCHTQELETLPHKYIPE